MIGYGVTSIGGGKISPSELEESPFVSDSSSGAGEGEGDGAGVSERFAKRRARVSRRVGVGGHGDFARGRNSQSRRINCVVGAGRRCCSLEADVHYHARLQAARRGEFSGYIQSCMWAGYI